MTLDACIYYRQCLTSVCPNHHTVLCKENPSSFEGCIQRIFLVSCGEEGFEPSIGFPLYTLSRRAPSTTRTSLQLPFRGIHTFSRSFGTPSTTRTTLQLPFRGTHIFSPKLRDSFNHSDNSPIF